MQDNNPTSSLVGTNGSAHTAPRKVSASSQRSTALAAHSGGAVNPSGECTDLIDSAVKQQKKSVSAEEQDKSSKRRKGDIEGRDSDLTEHTLDREKHIDSRPVDKSRSVDHERVANEEQNRTRTEKSKEKSDEKYDRESREKADRAEKRRGEDLVDRLADRSSGRREHSIERIQDRGTDRAPEKGREDRNKEERNKGKHAEPSIDRANPSDERFRGQSLPPPPPLPTSFVPQSVDANRRDEDSDRRGGSTRHTQRQSPRRDDKERWHLEGNASLLQDDGKHRREEDLHDRKREDRDVSSSKVDDRDRDKGSAMKEDSDPNSASKRRKIKKESALEAGEYTPSAPQLPSHGAGSSQLPETRERERKGAISQHRVSHVDDLPRVHAKDSASKTSRREAEQIHEREEEEKRPRTEAKRKHRK